MTDLPGKGPVQVPMWVRLPPPAPTFSGTYSATHFSADSQKRATVSEIVSILTELCLESALTGVFWMWSDEVVPIKKLALP